MENLFGLTVTTCDTRLTAALLQVAAAPVRSWNRQTLRISAKYLGLEVETRFSIPPIPTPGLRIVDEMIREWDVPAREEEANDTFEWLARLLQFARRWRGTNDSALFISRH
jgi:hypothetical protein